MYSFCFLTYFIIFIVCTLDLVPSVHSWQQRVIYNLVRLVCFGPFMAAAANSGTCYVRLQPGEIGYYSFIYDDICRFLFTSMLATEIE